MYDKMWKRGSLLVLAASAVAALTGGPIAAQSGPRAAVAVGNRAIHRPANSEGIAPNAVILYDQYNNQGGNSLTAQNFEAAYDAYDTFLADDFNATPGFAWRITQIDVDGVYSVAGPAASFNVYIHRNGAGNLPKDPPGITRLAQSYSVVGASTFRITVAPPMLIPRIRPSDHLWVAVQSNMNFNPNGQWFWTDRSVLSNSPSAWKNPGGGFGVGCLTWSNMNTCLAQVDPDLMYTLYGFAI
jgi:hypothetical protein